MQIENSTVLITGALRVRRAFATVLTTMAAAR